MFVAAGISDHPLDYQFKRETGFPYWTYSLFHKGSIQLSSRDKTMTVQAYDLKCIQPDTPYQTCISAGSKHWQGDWILGNPRPEWEALIQWPQIMPGVFHLNLAHFTQKDQIKQWFRTAVQECISAETHSDLRAVHAFEAILLACANLHQAPSSIDPRIVKAVEIVSTQFDRYLDIDILAAEVALSPSRLAHLFREEIGESPMSYREAARIRHAKQLLISTNMSVQEIGYAIAYENPFHFSKRFKQRVGISPKHFRQRLQEPGFHDEFHIS